MAGEARCKQAVSLLTACSVVERVLDPRINLAPTVGFEEDAGSRTTHHFMYPESAKNLAANVSFVLVPFKTLDLVWITSALSTGQIRL